MKSQHAQLFPSPRARSAWRGGVRGGGRRLLRRNYVRAHLKFGASVVPPPLAPRLRCVTRPSPPRNPSLLGFRINKCASRAGPTCVREGAHLRCRGCRQRPRREHRRAVRWPRSGSAAAGATGDAQPLRHDAFEAPRMRSGNRLIRSPIGDARRRNETDGCLGRSGAEDPIKDASAFKCLSAFPEIWRERRDSNPRPLA